MIIEPAAQFAAGFELDRSDVFERAIGRADSCTFALTRYRVSVQPGRTVRNKIAQALQELGTIRVKDMLVVHRWFGTTTRNALVISVELDERTKVRLVAEKALSSPPTPWEDLCLFGRRKTIVWSCTHDGDAVAFGTRDWLYQLGLTPRIAEPVVAVAQSIDRDAISEICRTTEK